MYLLSDLKLSCSQNKELKSNLQTVKIILKQFSIVVNNENPGVLILSPFAGAAETMHEALRVNPYELGNAAKV